MRTSARQLFFAWALLATLAIVSARPQQPSSQDVPESPSQEMPVDSSTVLPDAEPTQPPQQPPQPADQVPVVAPMHSFKPDIPIDPDIDVPEDSKVLPEGSVRGQPVENGQRADAPKAEPADQVAVQEKPDSVPQVKGEKVAIPQIPQVPQDSEDKIVKPEISLTPEVQKVTIELPEQVNQISQVKFEKPAIPQIPQEAQVVLNNPEIPQITIVNTEVLEVPGVRGSRAYLQAEARDSAAVPRVRGRRQLTDIHHLFLAHQVLNQKSISSGQQSESSARHHESSYSRRVTRSTSDAQTASPIETGVTAEELFTTETTQIPESTEVIKLETYDAQDSDITPRSEQHSDDAIVVENGENTLTKDIHREEDDHSDVAPQDTVEKGLRKTKNKLDTRVKKVVLQVGGLKRRVQDDIAKVLEESEDDARSGGPVITRVVVRKGGVAIAGPGGIATAGFGGTAIVGPGGTAYTAPDSTAVVGPGGRVISVPSKKITDMFAAFRAAQEKGIEGYRPDWLGTIPEDGKLVAVGPIVYRNPPNPDVEETRAQWVFGNTRVVGL